MSSPAGFRKQIPERRCENCAHYGEDLEGDYEAKCFLFDWVFYLVDTETGAMSPDPYVSICDEYYPADKQDSKSVE